MPSFRDPCLLLLLLLVVVVRTAYISTADDHHLYESCDFTSQLFVARQSATQLAASL